MYMNQLYLFFDTINYKHNLWSQKLCAISNKFVFYSLLLGFV